MIADLYFWRQTFILTTGLLYSASVGIMLSFPSVMTPALVSSNGTDGQLHASSSQAGWIAASNGISGMCGFFILSPILQISGRKIVHMTCNMLLLIGWIIFPLANNIPALYAARIIQGLAIGGVYINSMIIGEYVDPTRRGYFMTLKKVCIAIGTLICHSLSLIWNWRQISTFAIVLPTTSIIMTLLWPESPGYLAMKGKYKECEKSFLWLNGPSRMKELNHLIAAQTERIKNENKTKFYKFLLRKDFLRPLLIVSLLTLLLDLCGRYYFLSYVIQIMTELIHDESLAIYCTLGADSLAIIGLLTSCFFIRQIKRRTILYSFGALSVVLMFLISLIILLNSFNIATNLVWLTPSIIVFQNFIVNLGLIPVCFTIIGEIFPLEYKGSGSCISGIVFTSLYTVTLLLTPYLIKNTGIGGTYAVYGIGIGLSLVLLYFVVPETKDKTLQQIEDEIKEVKTPAYDLENNTLL